MRRLHLFEFGDQAWFPALLRDAETSYLALSYRLWPALTRLWAERIATVLDARKPAEILNLCSGSGGAAREIIEELQKRGYDVRVKLSDLYPARRTGPHPRIDWVAEPMDATRVPSTFEGVRTMFSAFHHFRPMAAQAILKDAFECRRAICIFEAGSGTALGIASMLGVPLAVLALMPLARPFHWAYFVLTYLIPLIPLVVLWDGIISMFRIYSPRQMEEMTACLQRADYAWEVGRLNVRGILGGLPYLIGRPVP